MVEELNLLIVAADPLAGMALANLLADSPLCRVAAVANPSTVEDVVADLEEDTAVDLVLWDWGWESAEATAASVEELELPVVALLSTADQVEEAWAAGVRGLVAREVAEEKLAAAAAAAAQGLLVFDVEMAGALLPVSNNKDDVPGEALTPREMEVLALLAEGLTNREIGQQLQISKHTVKFHVNSILGKLRAQSRTEAVVRATRQGYLAL
jgi:DNA-binding NarL/FixJ family response regulator